MYKYSQYFSSASYKSAVLFLVGSFKSKILYSSKKFPVSSKKMSSIPYKPPNVLVYVGENKKEVLTNIVVNILKCLHPDKYVVYQLQNNHVLKSPWKENTELLVVYCDEIKEEVTEAFQDYVESGGNMLVFCSNFRSKKLGLEFKAGANEELMIVNRKNNEDELVLCHGKYNYTLENGEVLATNTKEKSVLIKSMYKSSVLIVSEVHFALNSHMLPKADDKLHPNEENRLLLLRNILENEFGCEVSSLTKPVPTAGYIIVEDKGVPSKIKNTKKISLGPFAINEKEEDELIMPLLSEEETTSSILFDKCSYFSNLKTNNLGRTVVFFPVVTSTMIPADNLKDHKDVVVVAIQQVSGRGRSDNIWISPKGCATFTVPMHLLLVSRIGQRMSILQHMASIAVVHSIIKIPAYSRLDLRLKWPNDIYFGNDKKIGGVLVNTTIQGGAACAFIGVGVNVANLRPTVCINSVIESHNALTGEALPLVCTEKVIAGTLSELEYLVDDFEKNGSENFLKLYYTYWLHNEQKVLISALQKEAIIHGLDDYGFLIVQTVDGKRLTLQPDGNRFDMLKNLIVAKE